MPRRLSLTLAVLLLSLSHAFCADLPAPKKPAALARLQGALTLDGKLDEPAWQAAPDNTGFEMLLGQATRTPIPEELQTHFRVLCDDENLYFGIRCNEPQMDKLTALAAKQHDAAMWSDDDVELFLDPVGDRMEYYQLAVNSDATQVDLYYIERGNTGKAGWSSDWQAAAFKGKDFWSLEIAVPFALFHIRPSKMWADNWVFSISRTRTPAPGYFSMSSPGTRYHDVASFGTLGPIPADKTRYNLYADSPRYRLEPAEGGFNLFASLNVENRGDTPFAGTLGMDILADKSRGAKLPLQLAAKSSARVELPPAFIPAQGRWPLIFRAKSDLGYTALVTRFDDWLTYTPLTLKLTRPNYRNCIYATESIDTIKGVLKLGLPLDKLSGLVARISLTSSVHAPETVELKTEKPEIAFELPAADLPVGDYILRAELLRPLAKPKDPEHKFELLEETETALRKLPPAPVVEARVDDQGNLLINGSPIFIRGWYGSLGYCVSAASFPRAQLPHSTNFIMGASDQENTEMGLYSLGGATGCIDEAKAKLDQPIDADLKAKLRAVIAATRAQRNVIGYYISDEPECRGLSPFFLKSLYEFMAQEDPYRFCMIVSRDPETYISACDVMCPHPYLNPQLLDDGTRRFGSPLRDIHKTISAAAGANDGSKAVWSMPQTFNYGGLQGRDPDFRESRWFTFTSIANGAQGIVPFIFNGYWNHYESRLGMGYVFEELAFLAPAWASRDTVTSASSENPDIDVAARFYKPDKAGYAHTFIVAANQSYGPSKSRITVPALAQGNRSHLLVLRENRVVPVGNGAFTDDFEGLGVHVYTTLEVIPDFRTLDQIQAEITSALSRPAQEGNLLASGKIKWCVGEWGRNFQSDSDLTDGITDAAAWMPVYEDRTQCVILFEKPVEFSRLEFYTPTIKSADLDIWADGAWKTIHQWKDEYLYKLEWRGEPVKTEKLRIRPTAQRQAFGTWVYEEITELGIYK